MAITSNLSRGTPCSVDMVTQTEIRGGANAADQNVCMTGGRLFHVTAITDNAARAHLKIYNSKAVTVGTTAPYIVIAMNPGGGSEQNHGRTTVIIATGLKMNTAFSMAATATEAFASTTDPADTTLEVSVVFARTTDIAG